MSATENRGPIPGGQKGASGGVGQDPGSTRGSAEPAEWGAGVARAAAPRDFQAVVQDPWEEEGGQGAAQPVVQGNWDVLQVEEEEEGEEEEEEVEEEEEEDDEDEDDDEEEGEGGGEEEGGDEEGGKEEEENEEEEEYEEKEDEEEEDDSYEEEDENYMDKEEEETGKEGAEVVPDICEFPMVQFWPLFRAVIHSLQQCVHDNNHIPVQPHTGRVVVRCHSWEPNDPGEGLVPREVEDPEEVQSHPRSQGLGGKILGRGNLTLGAGETCREGYIPEGRGTSGSQGLGGLSTS